MFFSFHFELFSPFDIFYSFLRDSQFYSIFLKNFLYFKHFFFLEILSICVRFIF